MTYNDKWLLTDLKLQKDSDGQYYLSAKYHVDEEHRTKECIFPKIILPVDQTHAPLITACARERETNVDIGFGSLPVPVPPIEKVIEEKVQELTVEEIEKKLGHKIKIVNKKKPEAVRGFYWCSRCYYGTYFDGGICKDCTGCDNKTKKGRCRCLSIKVGDPCPYFKEREDK